MMKKHSVFHLFEQRKQRRPKKQLEGPFWEEKRQISRSIEEEDCRSGYFAKENVSIYVLVKE